MKKIIAAFLLVVLLLTFTSAFSESEITLPAGLRFGMTYDEALSVSGFREGYEYDWQQSMLKARGFNSTRYLFSRDVSIGGNKAEEFDVFFQDSVLVQVEYVLMDKKIPLTTKGFIPELTESFEKIDTILESKYGPALKDEECKSHRFRAGTLRYEWYADGTRQRFGLDSPYRKTRLLNLQSGGCVFIDNYAGDYLVGLTNDLTSNDAFAMHTVTYTYYDFQPTDWQENMSVDF